MKGYAILSNMLIEPSEAALAGVGGLPLSSLTAGHGKASAALSAEVDPPPGTRLKGVGPF